MSQCKVCGKDFRGHWKAVYCSDACRKAGRIELQRSYMRTEKGREANRRNVRKHYCRRKELAEIGRKFLESQGKSLD